MKDTIPSFENKLAAHHLSITRKPLEILQINVGKLCNQACHHCHVEAGPKRTEIMEKKTIDRLIELLDGMLGFLEVPLYINNKPDIYDC